MASSLVTRPTISGNMRDSRLYRSLGFGNTSRIALLGHADGLPLNDPYQVTDIQEAVNLLGADSNSPLLRGLLEVYNAGARDVWLVAAGPMDEYVEVEDRLSLSQDLLTIDGGSPGSYDQVELTFDIDGGFPYTVTEEIYNFYQKYYDRLTTAYGMLVDYDFCEIIVPLEASCVHNGGPDFTAQLISFCEDYHANTGMIPIGVIGTRRPSSFSVSDSINEMISIASANSGRSGSKFVILAAGEGAVSIPQLNFTFKSSIAAQTAANIASIPLSRGIAYTFLNNVVNLDSNDYTQSQLDSMVNARVNPAVRTQRAKRGAPFQTVILSDNTLAADGSDFWSLSQVRVVAKCSNTIRAMGYAWIGSLDFAGFKQSVFDYMSYMVKSNTIKDFRLDITKDVLDQNKINVDVSLTPFSGIRQIYFTVEVGPGA